MQGRALQALGKWSEAEPLFARVAETFPELADYARYYQGEALRKSAENAKSLSVFQSLIASHPQSLLIPKARLQMAEILVDRGDPPGAASLCEIVIRMNGNRDLAVQARFLLAQAKEKAGEWPEAEPSSTFTSGSRPGPPSRLTTRLSKPAERLKPRQARS